MIECLISGTQIGADIAGLEAAYYCGIKTGGWATKGFRTTDGPKPEYKDRFNIRESDKPSYASRTWKNVKDSDGTVRFATDFSSSGELCTLKAIETFKKPYFDIDLNENIELFYNKFHLWITNNDIRVLNVAGNGNHKIFETVKHFLIEYLTEYNR